MVTVLKRAPHDEFTLRLFFNLSNKIPHANKIYLWSMILEPNYYRGWFEDGEWREEREIDFRKKLVDSVTSDTVIIGIKDHLSFKDFNPWTDDKPFVVKHLDEMFKFFSDKKFILFTSLENLSSYLTNSNLKIIPWGGDITNQSFEYKNLQPVIEKDFSSPYSYVSLNRNFRSQRVVALSTLYNLELEKYGLISCMFKDKLETLPNWPFEPETTLKLEHGLNKLKSSTLQINDDENIYEDSGNTNVQNFQNKLVNYYQQTFVEIINETSFTEDCFLLTEKTLNSFYGCNFPILMCSAGSVRFLRDIGFDMFDDIVDHSYDLITDPIDRIQQAIYNNKNLLVNVDNTKELWIKNKDRFISNVNIAKNKLYNFYTDRAKTEFMKIVNGNI